MRLKLVFVAQGRGRIFAGDMRDREQARQVLSAMPSAIALTAEAATLRDGNPAAATPGIVRYEELIR